MERVTIREMSEAGRTQQATQLSSLTPLQDLTDQAYRSPDNPRFTHSDLPLDQSRALCIYY